LTKKLDQNSPKLLKRKELIGPDHIPLTHLQFNNLLALIILLAVPLLPLVLPFCMLFADLQIKDDTQALFIEI